MIPAVSAHARRASRPTRCRPPDSDGAQPVSDLNRFFTDNLAVVVAVLVVALAALAFLTIAQSTRLRRAVRGYRSLLGDSDGGSLQQVLDAHIGAVGTVREQLDQLVMLYDHLEARSRGSLQHVGVVRFNPFEDTGSDQSFAIALLDGRRDGIVISSLHGRGQTRIFAKPVVSGESTHTLSDEEAEAIRLASEGTSPTPAVG